MTTAKLEWNIPTSDKHNQCRQATFNIAQNNDDDTNDEIVDLSKSETEAGNIQVEITEEVVTPHK